MGRLHSRPWAALADLHGFSVRLDPWAAIMSGSVYKRCGCRTTRGAGGYDVRV
jgi:hypothetical protein